MKMHWTERDETGLYVRFRWWLWRFKRQGPLARWYHRLLRKVQGKTSNGQQIVEATYDDKEEPIEGSRTTAGDR